MQARADELRRTGVFSPTKPPSGADFLTRSVSSYPYERKLHEQGEPDYRRDQLFQYPKGSEAVAGLSESRGQVRSEDREATLIFPREDPGSALPDPREKIRRRFVSAKENRFEQNAMEYAKESTRLRFLVYTGERVLHSEIESERVRVMTLEYFPYDGSIRVFEPEEDNSGLWGGDFAKRHLPKGPDGEPLRLEAIAGAGRTVFVHGRQFVVADADVFTRRWLGANAGTDFGAPAEVPRTWHHSPTMQAHDAARPTTVGTDRGFEMNAALGFYSRAPDTRGRFNENNKKVLRFECVWDDRGRPFGDLQLVALHYYLEDETMEAVVRTGANAGRGAGAKLLSRGRIPVAGTGLGKDGEEEAEGGGKGGHGQARSAPAGGSPGKTAPVRGAGGYKKGPGSWAGTFVSPITGMPMYTTGAGGEALARRDLDIAVDERGVPVAPIDHVTPDLLKVGASFTLYGKTLTIRRADEFTRKWYAEALGMDQSSPADGPRGDIAGALTGSAAARAGVAAAAAVTGGTFMGGSARHALSAGLGSADAVATAARRSGGPWDRAGQAGRRPEVVPFDGVAALGDEEETRRNMGKLIPTYRNQKDIERLYRRGGKVMRFLARIVGPRAEPADEGRVFVVNFHLEDDTVSVFEQAAPNGGFSKGAFLDRGRYRNLNAEPDNFGLQASSGGVAVAGGGEPGDATRALEAEMAGLGKSTLRAIATDPLASSARREAATAQLRAAERRFGGMGHRFGYDQGVGQGQIVTAFAKEDRVGAGPTGVARARGVGVRERSRFVPPPRHFRATDFALAEEVEFSHAPGQRFRLLDCDEFTRSYMRDYLGMEAEAVDPSALPLSQEDADFRAMAMDVVTKPSAWLGGASDAAGSSGSGGKGGASPSRRGPPAEPQADVRRQREVAGREHTGRVGRALLGCVYSVRQFMRRSDRLGRGWVSMDDAITAMASYGAAPPAVSDDDVSRVLSDHSVTKSKAPERRFAGAAGGSPGKSEEAEVVVLGVSYDRLCDALSMAQELDVTRTAREDRVIQQLRSSLLSSRQQARRLFRELGRRVPGCITQDEFRMLLRRHHLDVGFEEEDVVDVMRRFPQAEVSGGYSGVAVSWRGFIETLLGAGDGSIEPSEVEEYVRFVSGIGKPLVDGAGTAPEVFEHRPRGSAWGLDPFDEREVRAYMDRREGFLGVTGRQEVREREYGEGREGEAEEGEETMAVEEVEAEEADPAGDWYAEAARADRAREPIGVATSPMRPHEPKPGFVDANGVAVDPEEGPAPAAAGRTAVPSSTREQVLERLRKFFRFRGAQLRRVLSLYGRPSGGLITLDSACNAIESAGFELRLDEREALLPGCTGPGGRADTVRTEELLVEVLGPSYTM